MPESTLTAGLNVVLLPYDKTQALGICEQRFPSIRATLTQIVIRGPSGETLAAGAIDPAKIEVGQTNKQADAADASGGEFSCAVAWSSPPVVRQAAYTVEFGGHSTVVNGSSDLTAVYLAVGG